MHENVIHIDQSRSIATLFISFLRFVASDRPHRDKFMQFSWYGLRLENASMSTQRALRPDQKYESGSLGRRS